MHKVFGSDESVVGLDQLSKQGLGKQLKEEDITIEVLRDCYKIMAKVVSIQGEKFLPIFERLHMEIKLREKNKNLIQIANQIASLETRIDTQTNTHSDIH